MKQFGVASLEQTRSAVITLMTPEPTDGVYKTEGAETFIRRYGYADRSGIENRMNFGGVHKAGIRHDLTNLRMTLIGFDSESGKIRKTEGRIALLDDEGIEAASWSFSSMLLHWNRKHNQACYVPSMSETLPERRYKYGKRIIVGNGTDFQLFLAQMANGNIYYDPGIKMEICIRDPKLRKEVSFGLSHNSCQLFITQMKSSTFLSNEITLLSSSS